MRTLNKLSKNKNSKMIFAILMMVMSLVVMAVPGLCTEVDPELEIDFDIGQMFTWAQTIINAMLPVVYIIMGVALGFLIIRAFKAAFN